jgi:hypothetical protein
MPHRTGINISATRYSVSRCENFYRLTGFVPLVIKDFIRTGMPGRKWYHEEREGHEEWNLMSCPNG